MINNLNLDKWMTAKTGYALLLLSFFLLAYLLPLGGRDLLVPDETRYAEIPREMIASGDWVTPRLNGVRYFEKPALGYWVHAASLLLFGENNFAVRFPSALPVGLSAILIFVLVRRMSRKESDDDVFPAVLAALIFFSCFEVFALGNTAVLDSLFSFFLTAAITAFFFASEERSGSAKERGFLILAGLACGLAFLTKGFIAFAVPGLVLAPYLIWLRRYRGLLRMGWLPILVAVLVVLPWSIVIHFREPDFWRFFFWNEHVHRFLAAAGGQHKRSFWFFFVAAPGLFLPWVFMIPAAMPGIKARLFEPGAQGRLLKLCLCWLVLPFLFFSLSRGKLFTYILPCFPPFAVLMTVGLSHVFRKNARNICFQGGAVLSAALFGLILIIFLYVQFHGFNGLPIYSHPWKAMMVVNGFIFFILCCLWASRSRIWQGKALFFGVAPLLLFFVAHFTIPDLTLASKSPGMLLEQNRMNIAAEDIVIADKESVTAVCWYLKRSDVYVLGAPGELDYGLGYKEAGGRLLDMQSAADFINRNRDKTVLIARAKKIFPWRAQLPDPVYEAQGGPSGYVIWKY